MTPSELQYFNNQCEIVELWLESNGYPKGLNLDWHASHWFVREYGKADGCEQLGLWLPLCRHGAQKGWGKTRARSHTRWIDRMDSKRHSHNAVTDKLADLQDELDRWRRWANETDGLIVELQRILGAKDGEFILDAARRVARQAERANSTTVTNTETKPMQLTAED